MSTPAAIPRTVVASGRLDAAPRAAGPAPCPASTCATCRGAPGGPARRRSGRPRSSARLWAGVFPNPKPGSTIRSLPRHAGPRRRARRPRCRSATISAMQRACSAPRRGCASATSGTPRSAATRARRVVVGHAPDVVEQVGPGVQRRGGDGRLGRVDRERHLRQRPRAGRGSRARRGRSPPRRRPGRGPGREDRRPRRGGRRPRRASGGPARRAAATGSAAARPAGRRRRTSPA